MSLLPYDHMISDLRSRIKWQNVNDVAVRQTDYGTV